MSRDRHGGALSSARRSRVTTAVPATPTPVDIVLQQLRMLEQRMDLLERSMELQQRTADLLLGMMQQREADDDMGRRQQPARRQSSSAASLRYARALMDPHHAGLQLVRSPGANPESDEDEGTGTLDVDEYTSSDSSSTTTLEAVAEAVAEETAARRRRRPVVCATITPAAPLAMGGNAAPRRAAV